MQSQKLILLTEFEAVTEITAGQGIIAINDKIEINES